MLCICLYGHVVIHALYSVEVVGGVKGDMI